MKYVLSLISAAVAACSLTQASASTVTVGQSTAIDPASYVGPVPSSVLGGGAPLYSAGGFVWQNQSGYGGDCQSRQGNASAATIFALDNRYDHEGCGNNLGMVRMDGTRFSVTSVDVFAQDFTKVSPVSSVVSQGVNFLPFDLTIADVLPDLDAVGILPFTPEASVFLAQTNGANAQAVADYQAWLNMSGPATTDRFYVAGYRNGVEIVRQLYGDTGGQTALALSGFTNIDEIVFGYYGENFLWDHYASDNGGYTVLGAGQSWCDYACEIIDIFGFDYALAGGSKPSTGVSAVPLPSGIWMMFVALGLLGWGGRRKV